MIELQARGNWSFKHKPEMVSEIFSFLLKEKGIKLPSMNIGIINDELNEAVTKIDGRIFCNVRYPFDTEFEQLPPVKKNNAYTDVLIRGLELIVKKYPTINIQGAREVATLMSLSEFNSEIPIKVAYSKAKDIEAQVVLKPGWDSFKYYIVVNKQGNRIIDLLLIEAIRDTYLTKDLFQKISFLDDNKVIIYSKNKLQSFALDIPKNKVSFINNAKSTYDDIYEMMNYRSRLRKNYN